MSVTVAETVSVEIDGVMFAYPSDMDPIAWAYAVEEAAETDEELAMAMTAWKVAALLLRARVGAYE